jgi:hypothetical protein
MSDLPLWFCQVRENYEIIIELQCSSRFIFGEQRLM